MRVLALALAAMLALPAAARAQQAWAKAYEDGVELFEKGNYALAEQKLVEARDHPRAPKQSRRANFSSVVYRAFIPDFYLGIIYARRGDDRLAERTLEKVLNDGLVTEGDRANFALATSTLQQSRQRLAASTKAPPPGDRPPSVTTPTNTSPTGTSTAAPTSTTPTPAPPPVSTPATTPIRPTTPTAPPAEPSWMAPFRKSMEASREALRQGHYGEARGNLDAAARAAGDASSRQQAEAQRREIDQALAAEASRVVGRARAALARKDASAALTEVATLETLSPGHGALAELNSGIERLNRDLQGQANLAQVERTGVKLFLEGNYNRSAAVLKQAVDGGVKSPRIYLFLASSRAAEALLAPQDRRDALLAEARRTYALAKPGASASDERFISPSILQLLNGS